MRVQQQVDERVAVLARARSGVAGAGAACGSGTAPRTDRRRPAGSCRRQARLLDDVDQPEIAHAQRGLDQLVERHPAVSPPSNSTPVAAERAASAPIGSLPGRNCDHAPGRAGAGHEPAVQRRPQPAVDQRGLAAARGADDREEAVARELVDHPVDLALAAEEQVLLVLAERPQAGKGFAGRRCRPVIRLSSQPPRPAR